jgi:hypothetical protein
VEAGADLHVTDDAGTSPMDLARGSTQACLIAYNEKGIFEELETIDVEHESGGINEDSGEKSLTCRKMVIPETVSKAFGAAVAHHLGSGEWKARQQAIQEVTICMQQLNAQASSATRATVFDGACDVLVIAAKDNVVQVFSSAMPLIKAAFNVVLPTAQFHTPQYHASHPRIGELIELLLVRAAAAHEREANDAVASLLFLACKSVHATQTMTQNVIGNMLPKCRLSSWRHQLVYIRLLTAISSQYRFSTDSGLQFEDVMMISTYSLEHSSVKVRTAAVDLLIQAILIMKEASGKSKNIHQRYNVERIYINFHIRDNRGNI